MESLGVTIPAYSQDFKNLLSNYVKVRLKNAL